MGVMGNEDAEFIQGIITAQNAENARQRRAAAEEREAMIAEADELARRFVEAQPSIRRILLFGSLVFPFRGRAPRDIDLWVEGTPDLAALERIADGSPFSIDVIDGRPDGSAISIQVQKYGKVLYEAQS